jgi:uncharacterized protein
VAHRTGGISIPYAPSSPVLLHEALKELLPNGCFPSPKGDALDGYLQWDDWRILGLLASGQGGEHGLRLATRDHYREAFHTGEVRTTADLDRLDRVRTARGPLLAAEQSAEKSWYATGQGDIPVVGDPEEGTAQPLSKYSGVVANLRRNQQVRLYVRPEEREPARQKIQAIAGEHHE